jgi:hypothetical protein
VAPIGESMRLSSGWFELINPKYGKTILTSNLTDIAADVDFSLGDHG